MQQYLDRFLDTHSLPPAFLAYAKEWFDPLVTRIASLPQKEKAVCIGISGCQGSGKSTLADYCRLVLEKKHGLTVAALSLDDIYLTQSERIALAQTVHPLLRTRGVPGTHDTDLGISLLSDLKEKRSGLKLPIFDKLVDDRHSETISIDQPVDIVIFEGWCLGAEAQPAESLPMPCNTLEEQEDGEGIWRQFVNTQLETSYQTLFSLVDYWVALKAPSFECVKDWRLEQEEKLAQKAAADHATINSTGAKNQVMNKEAIVRFTEHYQRLTECLISQLPDKADYLFELNSKRVIQSAQSQSND